jgi:hypothetical protein
MLYGGASMTPRASASVAPLAPHHRPAQPMLIAATVTATIEAVILALAQTLSPGDHERLGWNGGRAVREE